MASNIWTRGVPIAPDMCGFLDVMMTRPGTLVCVFDGREAISEITVTWRLAVKLPRVPRSIFLGPHQIAKAPTVGPVR